jgi:hypothetical protein
MIRLAPLLSLLALGCGPTALPDIDSPVNTEGKKPIKGGVLVPTASPKVPVQDHLLDHPFLVVEEGPGFTVEGAWAQPERVLLSRGGAPGSMGASWQLLDLVKPEPERRQKPEDVQPVEIFSQDGAPLRAFPRQGVLVLEGQSRDVAVSMETGEVLPWVAELPDGETTDEHLRFLGHRDSDLLWFVLDHGGALRAGYRLPGGDEVVPVGHRLPWQPDAVTAADPASALAWSPLHSAVPSASDCPYFTLPQQGVPQCVPQGLNESATLLHPLGQGWWAVTPPMGPFELVHAATGRRDAVFEEHCAEGEVLEGALTEPPRLLASCRRAESHVELRLWSPQATYVWTEYIHPSSQRSPIIGAKPVVGFGDPDSGRLTWIDMERAERLETPRLATPGMQRSVSERFFALEQGENSHSVYRVDAGAKQLDMWGLILDCDGELEFTPGDGYDILECNDYGLRWAEVLYHDGRWFRVKGHRIELVLEDRFLVTDRVNEAGLATKLWVVPSVEQVEEEEE